MFIHTKINSIKDISELGNVRQGNLARNLRVYLVEAYNEPEQNLILPDNEMRLTFRDIAFAEIVGSGSLVSMVNIFIRANNNLSMQATSGSDINLECIEATLEIKRLLELKSKAVKLEYTSSINQINIQYKDGILYYKIPSLSDTMTVVSTDSREFQLVYLDCKAVLNDLKVVSSIPERFRGLFRKSFSTSSYELSNMIVYKDKLYVKNQNLQQFKDVEQRNFVDINSKLHSILVSKQNMFT